MLEYTFLYTFILCTSLFFGIYALSLSPQNRSHQLFLGAALCVSFVCGLCIYSNRLDDPEQAWVLYKCGIAVCILFPYILYLFIVTLTGFHAPPALNVFLFLLFMLSLIISLTMDPIFELVKDNDIWKLKAFRVSPWLYYQNTYIFIFSLFHLYILIKKFISSSSNREKRMYLVLSISTSFCIMPFFVIWILMKYADNEKYWAVAPMPVYFLFFLAGCLYCVVNYRLFHLTPGFVSKDILANIDDSIILLDHENRITTANSRTSSLVKLDTIAGLELSDIIFEYPRINPEIENLKKQKINDFSCRLHFKDKTGGKILMDTRFSTVKDKFNDVLGILLIGKEVKEISQLKNIFKLTNREAEIIQSIISGRSNIEIAEEMEITENTVKRHITNIYNKLCCNNRMQLLSTLKGFNIVPEQESERTLIIC